MTPPEMAAAALHLMRRQAEPAVTAASRRVPDSIKRDWHQFRLLSRDGVRQLLDAALFSRDADPMQFALWMLALVATPSWFFAVRQVMTYTALVNAPPEVVERVALGHRLFFVVYGMLAAALLAALTWEALFPDGRDQEIIGVLPVKPSTYAASKLWAALVVGVGFTAAVNLPPAFIYSAFSIGHPILRAHPFGLFFGHVLATMLGALLVYLVLLFLRGAAAVVLGARAGAWLGALLQLVTVILLVETFFFLPGVLGQLVGGVERGDPRMTALPPVWFAALHAWLAGNRDPIIETAAARGVMWFVAAAILVVPIYLLPARWLGRRALETRGGDQARSLWTLLGLVATLAGAGPAVRAIYMFTVASLLRSRRHLLVLSTYVGVAIAMAILSLVIIEVRRRELLEAPGEWALALPLLFIYFLVLGLRASFRIPTEIEANWPFRLAPPAVLDSIRASALVMFTVAIVPVTCLTVVALSPFWTAGAVATTAFLQVVAGVVLIDIALVGWIKVPFACGHAPSPEVLKAKWPIYAVAMYVYAFKLSDWQLLALTSRRALTTYLVAAATAMIVLRVIRWRRAKRQSLEFDAPTFDTVERLNLSGALN